MADDQDVARVARNGTMQVSTNGVDRRSITSPAVQSTEALAFGKNSTGDNVDVSLNRDAKSTQVSVGIEQSGRQYIANTRSHSLQTHPA